MVITEKQKIELFDEFYDWLVADGLKARKSPRLHKKTIFASLMANKEMSVENFKDFIVYKKEKNKKDFIYRIENLVSKYIFLMEHTRYILSVKIDENENIFKINTSYFDYEQGKEVLIVFPCKFSSLEMVENKLVKENCS